MTTTIRQQAIRVAVSGLVLGAGLAFGGVPLNNLQGVGGVAFNPLAYPSGQNAEEDKDKGGLHLALSRPQIGAWYVRLGDVNVDWVAGGVSETFFKRLELSYGYEIIAPDGADNIHKSNYGAKVLLLPENAGDNAFVPAVSVGGLWKTTDVNTGDTIDDAGWDAYVVATKLITQLPRPVLLSGGLLYTDELVTGVFGHDDQHDLTWFANVDVLPFSFLAVGLEYKDGARFDDFQNASYWDAHVAWFVNPNLTLVGAYVNAGDSDPSSSKTGLGDGFVLSAQYAF
jgi:hypothetical protein